MTLKLIVKIGAIAYTLFIIYASLAKYAMGFVPKNINGGDKIAHFGAYFVFVILWSFTCKMNLIEAYRKENLKYVAVSGLLLGLLMEVCQYVFTSYRQMDWLDMLANSVGVLLGCLVSVKFIFTTKKH